MDAPFVARRPGSAHEEKSGTAGAATAPQRAVRDLSHFASLAPLIRDPATTDVFVNAGGEVWADQGQGILRQPFLIPRAEVRDLAVRLVGLGGRHVDESSPAVDARLHDGIRVHAVLPPVSPAGTLLSIRVPRIEVLDVAALEAARFFERVAADRILALVAARKNLLITGAAGAGKTTLLSALLTAAPETERIIAIEDVGELRVNHPHFVSLESRQANLEGAGEIGLARLLREALRMRPDRLVLGECRGAEIRELLGALNTGHDGGAGTMHANSLDDVPARLEALGALAGMTTDAVARQTVSAIDTVLHLERKDGVRQIAEIGRFILDGAGRLSVVPA